MASAAPSVAVGLADPGEPRPEPLASEMVALFPPHRSKRSAWTMMVEPSHSTTRGAGVTARACGRAGAPAVQCVHRQATPPLPVGGTDAPDQLDFLLSHRTRYRTMSWAMSCGSPACSSCRRCPVFSTDHPRNCVRDCRRTRHPRRPRPGLGPGSRPGVASATPPAPGVYLHQNFILLGPKGFPSFLL